MVWRSLKRAARRRRERAGVLERAYRSVFLCPDGEIVLADLAAECGIYQAPPVNLEPRAGGYLDGRKALYARILSMIRIPPEEHAALQEAARLEMLPEFETDEEY
ncbi:hypothetical protein ACP90_08975 [Labrenzia sp. CP4]|jgi:hypothetical protein|uniref:Bbp19-like phage domain-containing protein n=1 Tax=Roseibium aggregatum (strain ATCC 25650 / DSM 13394 / JCM 20685 / NBRC 16684 / NCIMB 2208 / IAM 12614 / B1) TaxID=384765 RepID=A0NVU5_ROSAI|nr:MULTISPECIES: hypothetical protein [Stappiaceae]MEE4012051.1 hypothetical protein [Roseibium sp. FZY0029]AMN52538.1 hypothetical protein ACP90_08975 [Labrenzia sp. CP4]EAV43110.1 hypothetical protein SIAM614_19841 [Stappia aggregata IAM 12614] [Roseibium aggregatum IAM 12614]MBN8181850.1 hypothetical protein [Roseibium aggregatum]QFS98690.1 hypothetical protein FIV06_14780 [Labrenzia sp. THAF191b]